MNKQIANLVEIKGDDLWTTSVLVAEKFGKRHKDVLRKIEKIRSEDARAGRNFAPSSYLGEDGADTRMYLISEDGFLFVSLGFTGSEAAKWKWDFIDAFKMMRAELTRIHTNHANAEWIEARKTGKRARLAETDAVKAFVEYATAMGSKSAGMYYQNITKGTYGALFILEHGGKWEGIRELLSHVQLTTLASAERIAQKALRESMDMDMHYKDGYQYAIGKVKEFAKLIGMTKIPEQEQLALIKGGKQ